MTGIFQNGGYGNSLHSLCAPVGRNLGRMTSPEFFGIALKENLIELFSEMIHIEIFKIIFFFLENRTFNVTETSLRRLAKAQIFHCSAVNFYRVFKELFVKIDAGNSLPCKHHFIFKFRIGSARRCLYVSF